MSPDKLGTARTIEKAERYQEKTEREMNRAQKQQLGATSLASYAKGYLSLNMEDFSQVYTPGEIRRDQEYVQEMKAKFGSHSPQADQFEGLFVDGIVNAGWLGQIDRETGNEDFSVLAAETTDYDDISNAVDAYAVLDFGRRMPEIGNRKKLPIGFDVTISGSDKVVMGKLTKFYSDGVELPYGYSHIKYYYDGNIRREMPEVLRYVIGISGYNVKYIEKKQNSDTGRYSFGADTSRNFINRFKVLAEMRAENELYSAMLPDERELPAEKRADRDLEFTGELIEKAYRRTVKAIVERRMIADADIRRMAEKDLAEKPDVSRKLCKIVEDYYLELSHRQYLEDVEEQTLKQKQRGEEPKEPDPNDPHEDTFVQIISCCRRLIDAAYTEGENGVGLLDKYRRVAQHNQGFRLVDDDTNIESISHTRE